VRAGSSAESRATPGICHSAPLAPTSFPVGVEGPLRHTYLVYYDISDDARRGRVLKLMTGFGDHLQYSVFECQLNGTDSILARGPFPPLKSGGLIEARTRDPGRRTGCARNGIHSPLRK